MNRLFFELVRVASGRLECLDRSPSPEEWQELYEWSKQQQVEGVCYHGLERLFAFGLRAPQDVSLDWMADAEAIREQNEQAKRSSRIVQYYPEELKMLRHSDDDVLAGVNVLKIEHVYRLFLQRRLNVRMLMDYGFVLIATSGKNETLSGEGWAGTLTDLVGVRRFARGLMWLLQESLRLEREYLPWKPLESEGRYLMRDMMRETSRLQRMIHMLRYFKVTLA